MLPDLQGLSFMLSRSPTAKGDLFLLNTNQINIHMEIIIAKENLADFIVKMWDANIQVEIKPSENYLILWSNDFKKRTHVNVGHASYEDVMNHILSEFKED